MLKDVSFRESYPGEVKSIGRSLKENKPNLSDKTVQDFIFKTKQKALREAQGDNIKYVLDPDGQLIELTQGSTSTTKEQREEAILALFTK